MALMALAPEQRKLSQYIRLGVTTALGVGLCLIPTMSAANNDVQLLYSTSPWMIPTLCIVYFLAVVAIHVKIPGKSKRH